ASEMPSLALRIATFMPRIWVFIRSAIARPAASSLALLTRRPEDRRCTAVASELLLVCRLRWALRDIRLVLITWDIGFSLASGDAWRHDAIGGVTPIGGKAGVVPTRFPSSGNRKRGPAGYHPVGPLRPWPSRGDQRRRLGTVFGMALACESIATPACCRTWARVIAAVSAAKSASMMRLRAAVWLSTATCRFEMTDSKRFWAAP